MGSSGSEAKISLKILVDVKSNKVEFAEAGKDFVDFIFTIMSLPLSTVTKLLTEKDGMVGCLGSLYKSIETLGVQYYEPDHNKDLVLTPRLPAVVPLLALNNDTTRSTTIKFYACERHAYAFTDHPGTYSCSHCLRNYTQFNYTYTPPVNPGYVKEAVPYIVMDNLEVKPMSVSLIRSLVKDFEYLEEKQVQFGLQEGLALLKASLENQAVLTTVFLGKKK